MNDYFDGLMSFVPFFLSFFMITIIVLLVFSMLLKKNHETIKIFGIFMGLKNVDILSLTLITVEYIFFIWSLFEVRINIVYFLVLLLCSTIFEVINKRIINIVFAMINSIIVYFGLYCKCIFNQYIINVANIWYVHLLLIFLSLFLFIYVTYFSLRKTNFILKQNKYVKKVNKNQDTL